MKLKLLLIAFIISPSLFAQVENETPIGDALPRYMTDAEKKIMGQYYSNYQFGQKGIETPPTGNIRCAAQWEEVQSLVITWTGQYNIIQSKIVDAAQEECRVLIACSDSNSVKTTLANNGVPDVNLEFIEIPFNSIWMRDYGSNTMYKNDVDSLFVVDWIYNRPRPDDDVMPEQHALWHNIPIYTTTSAPSDLVNTGGNWMVDGHGTAFASELILEENEPGNPYFVTAKNETDIDNIMSDFMGITRYIKMPVLPYDNIHHIDMHMKLLDEETLLVSEYPAGVADGPQIEANLQYVLANHNSVFGTPYKVVRIVVPPSTGGSYPNNGGSYRTYSNSVFINKTVLVPTYRPEYDTTAINTLQAALPGYTLVEIDVDNSGQNLISLSGAIHCITHSIGVADPLRITHQSLEDTYNDVTPYIINADLQHVSGITAATLYYTTTLGGAYTSVSMMYSGTGNTWNSSIPAQAVGTTIYYYIEGNATSGKVGVRPIVAPTGYWDFKILSSAGLNESVLSVSLDDVFPNPASAITCIPVNASKATNAKITLRDVTGKLIETIFEGEIPMGESKYFLMAHEYAAGSYLIVFETNDSQVTKKLMIR